MFRFSIVIFSLYVRVCGNVVLLYVRVCGNVVFVFLPLIWSSFSCILWKGTLLLFYICIYVFEHLLLSSSFII